MNNKIRFLHNSDIDIQRWDSVVEGAVNARVYAMSWYLDILFPDWYGIIYEDYQYVMPVVFSRKWGIQYAFQPVFAQQHGIFPVSPPHITSQFFSFLQDRFRYFNISVNSMNLLPEGNFTIEKRKNYILSLKKGYGVIHENYSSHTARYVRKANSIADISEHITLEDFLRLKTINSQRTPSKKNMVKLKQIIAHALNENSGKIYGAYSKHNELYAAAFFLKYKNRFIYLSSVSTPEGKQQRSMFAIVDKFINEHAGSSFLLDFEGSNIDGIARFFDGFGAQPELYQHAVFNNLPWFVKLIKH